ncbi:hypothetical protein GCM10027568_12260 [Humibacter soli]
MKQSVIASLDELTDVAREVGAVNTVVITPDRLVGQNTDVYGFSELAARTLRNERADIVVQFGAGGAGASVAYAQLQRGVDRLTIVDIDTRRAEALASSMGGVFGRSRVVAARPDEFHDLAGEADGFVNATPMGMAGHPGSPVDPELITDRHWVIDIVYLPLETQFMRDATARGARVTGGAAMTAFQAAGAFELFTGVSPDAERMLQHMQALVAERLAG